MKMVQQAITETLGTNEKLESLSKEIESLNKEEPNGTEKHNSKTKNSIDGSIAKWRKQKRTNELGVRTIEIT